MKKCLKVKLLILIFLTGIQYMSAQGTAVNGTVVSDQNDPLVGVTVTEAGTTNGVITDINGKFSITLKNATGNLNFSYVGFTTQTIAVNNQSKNLKIVLAEDSKQLDLLHHWAHATYIQWPPMMPLKPYKGKLLYMYQGKADYPVKVPLYICVV